MAPSISKKRKLEDGLKGRTTHTKKPRRKQSHYSSSSPTPSAENSPPQTDEFPPIELENSDSDTSPRHARSSVPSISSSSNSSTTNSDSEASSTNSKNPNETRLHKRKRNDPDAFSLSISKILSSKLSASKRSDPVLARSATAQLASRELADSRLETKARQKLREDKKVALEKGRVKDVLMGTVAQDGDGDGVGGEEREGGIGEMQELEKRLRKTAQRGVVKLFNAVRGAQVKGEEAARKGGARGRKEERVGEMSKKGFLELVAGGGSKTKEKANVEQA